ncbi:ATP-binding cassette domain-containing protein [Psittacicella hinzii]|uniref:ATP-binding protein Uup n=1 Tax=Psittacicella hinzii TaxID=2028575 RepID=A0A3A1YQ40_9GAMM|nr:ATP-binding cassette domain-containing protein [Psittacicella hinzii]RIY40312.1 hypothetical protein CKF58_00675 [Psittacicella hinzii]
MSIVRLTDASLSFGDHVILDQINLSIEPHERLCIVGRNGSGKSTLLKVLRGTEDLDAGSKILENNVQIAYLRQDPPERLDLTTYEYVSQGAQKAVDTLAAHQAALEAYAKNHSPELAARISQLEAEISTHDYWSVESKIIAVMEQLGIPVDAKLSSFSGGWLRRIELAKAFVANPNVLLLDEPTNHLDISSIQWLEQVLQGFPGAVVFISHDRSFVDNMATRIVELDRGHIYEHPGNFAAYLKNRDKRLEDERNQNALFAKELAKEEAWIRRGIEARRTRNEGRVRALKAMRVEAQNMRKLTDFGEVKVTTSRSGKLVFELDNVGLTLGNKEIFKDFTYRVAAKNRIAIVGDNGCGKSSLIKVLLQELPATTGHVHIGTNLQVAYFDQLRAELDLDKTAIDNVFDGKVEAYVHGHVRHAIGYLGDFMFTAEKARAKVSSLSGGERNRLLLAKILAKTSNLLVLDEPTNDLDIETLELLEDLVSNYDGTIIIVSHDRSFIDNVAVETWFMENQQIYPYVGGYSDNVQRHAQIVAEQQAQALAKEQRAQAKLAAANGNAGSTNTNTAVNGAAGTSASTSGATALQNAANQGSSSAEENKGGWVKNRTERLSYKEKQDLKTLPTIIDELQSEIEALHAKLAEMYLNPEDYNAISEVSALVVKKEEQMDELQTRWLELEDKRERLGEVID